MMDLRVEGMRRSVCVFASAFLSVCAINLSKVASGSEATFDKFIAPTDKNSDLHTKKRLEFEGVCIVLMRNELYPSHSLMLSQ